MAMLPFCGYNMSDYLPLARGRRARAAPAIFHVNWFRTDRPGVPGRFGGNVRSLMIGRITGRVKAQPRSASSHAPGAEPVGLLAPRRSTSSSRSAKPGWRRPSAAAGSSTSSGSTAPDHAPPARAPDAGPRFAQGRRAHDVSPSPGREQRMRKRSLTDRELAGLCAGVWSRTPSSMLFPARQRAFSSGISPRKRGDPRSSVAGRRGVNASSTSAPAWEVLPRGRPQHRRDSPGSSTGRASEDRPRRQRAPQADELPDAEARSRMFLSPSMATTSSIPPRTSWTGDILDPTVELSVERLKRDLALAEGALLRAPSDPRLDHHIRRPDAAARAELLRADGHQRVRLWVSPPRGSATEVDDMLQKAVSSISIREAAIPTISLQTLREPLVRDRTSTRSSACCAEVSRHF